MKKQTLNLVGPTEPPAPPASSASWTITLAISHPDRGPISEGDAYGLLAAFVLVVRAAGLICGGEIHAELNGEATNAR